MRKINGRRSSNRSSVAGFDTIIDYTMAISRMETEDLYRHGAEEFKIKPSKAKNARQTFERKCIAEFRKVTGQVQNKDVPESTLNKSQKSQLSEALKRAK